MSQEYENIPAPEAEPSSVENASDAPAPADGKTGRYKWAVSALEWLELFVVSLSAVLLVITFIIRHSPVNGLSMYDTLNADFAQDGKTADILLVSDLFYTPERGDIIVVQSAKYGYDTPESFSRAFTRFHGISPSAARQGGHVRSFSRISVKLTITGGNMMDYRIEKKGAIKVACRRINVTKPTENGIAYEPISAFWRECGADGTIPRLCSLMAQPNPFDGILGICFTEFLDGSTFPYGIGAACRDDVTGGDGIDVV